METRAEETFLARNSPEGLFLRYARDRTRGFLLRQSMTVAGGLMIAVAYAPWLGAICAALAVSGDGLEHLVLRRAHWRSDRHDQKSCHNDRWCAILATQKVPPESGRFVTSNITIIPVRYSGGVKVVPPYLES